MTERLSIEEKLDSFIKRIDNLEEEVVSLKNENRGLKSQVNQLTDRLAKYENPKNSKNSSKPPSSDFPKLPKTQSLRESSGKKPGGQSGHDGTTLRMVTNPDMIKTHCPSFCTCCGEDLSTIPAIFVGKRQVIDIPPIIPIVTEHQLFNKCCKCGKLNQSSFPTGVNAPVSYGENVQALTAYLSVRQYVPFNRLAELLSNLFGLSVSTGGIDYILTKMKSKASVAYESIRQNVLKNKVIGADETGISINGTNNWAWTFQHKKATFISIHKNRGFNAIKEIMPEGLQNNILVTDCWSSYFKTDAAKHQLCTAHLLRELTHFEEKYQNVTWASRMLQIITKALDLRRDNKATKDKVDEILYSFSMLIIEPLNKDLKAVSLAFAGDIADAYELNGQEQKIGPANFSKQNLNFDLSHYTIKSFAVKLAAANSKAGTIEQQAVILPYNQDVMSYDDNREDGEIRRRSSIPAELVGNEIISEDIRFKMGNRYDGENNAVVCKGQVIELPVGDYDHLYFLAAANGDTRGEFKVDNESEKLSVQNWTGYIGQFYNREFALDGVTVTKVNAPYSKLDNIAWFSSHYHKAYPSSNMAYQYCYLYKYGMAIPKGAKKLTLPDNNKIVVLAITVAKNENLEIRQLQPLYDNFSKATTFTLHTSAK